MSEFEQLKELHEKHPGPYSGTYIGYEGTHVDGVNSGDPQDDIDVICEFANAVPALIKRLEDAEKALDEANAGYFSNWLVNQVSRGYLAPHLTAKQLNDAYKEHVKANDPALAKALEEKV